MRKDRAFNQMRNISFEIDSNVHAEGSCLVKFGNTHVICTASVEEKIPPWLKNTGKGWVTAEYGMLPRSTNTRIDRESARGKQTGRTQEIQRLIGRSLRSIINLENLGERQIKVDCDVIQADGGTRTASISGGFIALYLAINKVKKNCKIIAYECFDLLNRENPKWYKKYLWTIGSNLNFKTFKIFKSFGTDTFLKPKYTNEISFEAEKITNNFILTKPNLRDLENLKVYDIWI